MHTTFGVPYKNVGLIRLQLSTRKLQQTAVATSCQA